MRLRLATPSPAVLPLSFRALRRDARYEQQDGKYDWYLRYDALKVPARPLRTRTPLPVYSGL